LFSVKSQHGDLPRGTCGCCAACRRLHILRLQQPRGPRLSDCFPATSFSAAQCPSFDIIFHSYLAYIMLAIVTLLSLTAALVAQASSVFEKRQRGCSKVYHIHARGTAEPGSLGILVGTPFSVALKAKFPGQVQSVGVQYAASITGAVTCV
jgi:hypothetical protein